MSGNTGVEHGGVCECQKEERMHKHINDHRTDDGIRSKQTLSSPSTPALRRYLKQRQQLGMSALSITIGASLTVEVGRREMVCSSLRLSAFKVLHCRRGGPDRNC